MSSFLEEIRPLLQKYFDKYQPYDGEAEQTLEAITKLIEDRIIPKKRTQPPDYVEKYPTEDWHYGDDFGWNACIEEQRRRLRG